MFEKYLIDRRLRAIMASTIEIGKINQALIKQKLIRHKALLKNPSKETIDAVVFIIQRQEEALKTLKRILVDLDYSRNLSLTPHIKIALSLIKQGESILNNLNHNFYAQRCALTDNSTNTSEQIRNYSSYFHDELTLYKEYEKLSNELPPELMREVKNEIVEFNNAYSIKKYIEMTSIAIIMFGFWGFLKPDVIKTNFKDVETTIYTIGTLVITFYFLNRFSIWLKKLKNK